MLVRFFIAILVLALALLAGALLLPANVHVERSITVERPPSVVFGLLNDFEHFQAWSPWADRDPNARYEISGPENGVGARLAWEGDPRQVGTGSQEITASEPYSLIRVRLDFEGQGTAQAYYDIRPAGRDTRLEWGFDTDVTEGRGFFDALIGKYMGLVFKYWVGDDYETGLERFKQYAETFPDADYSDIEIEVMQAEADPILYIPTSSGQSEEALANALGAAYGAISRYMASRGIERVGKPMSISHAWDENSYEFDAAIPVGESINAAQATPTGNIRLGQSPSGPAVRAVHVGPYGALEETYRKVAAYMAVHGLEHSGVTWEHYISDPGETREQDLITHVYFMIENSPESED